MERAEASGVIPASARLPFRPCSIFPAEGFVDAPIRRFGCDLGLSKSLAPA